MKFADRQNRSLVIAILAGFVIMIGIEVPLLNTALKGKEKDFNDRLFYVVGSLEQQMLLDSSLMNTLTDNASVIRIVQNHIKATVDSAFNQNEIPLNYVLAAGKAPREITNFSEISRMRENWQEDHLIWSGDPANNPGLLSTRLKLGFLGEPEKRSYYVKIFFPQKKLFLLKDLLPQIIAMMFTLVLLFVCFLLLLSVLKKQKQLATSKTDFIANMTHELKTPLFTISIATKMLAEQLNTKGNDKLGTYVKTIREETARLVNLADKALKTSETHDQENAQAGVTVNIHDSIRKAMSRLMMLKEDRGVQLETRLDARQTDVSGNEDDLENVFVNVIDNGIKYSAANPRIVISTKNEGNNIVVSIADNGIGFDSESNEIIFERFFRANTGNIHNIKGYGIGLSFAKSVVDAHNGKIKATSVVGKGSDFVIVLPCSNNVNE